MPPGRCSTCTARTSSAAGGETPRGPVVAARARRPRLPHGLSHTRAAHACRRRLIARQRPAHAQDGITHAPPPALAIDRQQLFFVGRQAAVQAEEIAHRAIDDLAHSEDCLLYTSDAAD